MPFVKLDCDIVRSSIFAEPSDTLKVWVALLALAKPDGEVRISDRMLGVICQLDEGRLIEIITTLLSADQDSASQESSGSRIKRVAGGFSIVNYARYRAKDYGATERSRRYRAKTGNADATDATPLHSVTTVTATQAEAEAEAEKKKDTIGRPEEPNGPPAIPLGKTKSRFAEFWIAYPKKTKRKPAEAKWKARRLDDTADRIIADVRARLKTHRPWQEGFIPDALTYINQDRWEDEIEDVSTSKQGPRMGSVLT